MTIHVFRVKEQFGALLQHGGGADCVCLGHTSINAAVLDVIGQYEEDKLKSDEKFKKLSELLDRSSLASLYE